LSLFLCRFRSDVVASLGRPDSARRKTKFHVGSRILEIYSVYGARRNGPLCAGGDVMRSLHVLVAAGGVVAGIMATANTARADLVNGAVNVACTLTPEHPYPVVLVHGQAGNVEGMSGVSDRLAQEGFCVYGTNYGFVEGGANGQAHLWESAGQISNFIDGVLQTTGAKKVDVVGHSAGTGVLDNYIMTKGGASKVHGFVSFDGLHHPYWHLGVPKFFDIDVFLPNLMPFAQRFFPGITIDMITNMLAGFVDPGLAATIKSPFAKDLFDTQYWIQLQGSLSEPVGTFVKFPSDGRTFPTHDSRPGICYTSIVAVGDMLVGGSAGWMDAAPNMDNFLTSSVVTANSHNDVLGNVDALNEMVKGLKRDCAGGGAGGSAAAGGGAAGGLAPQDASGLGTLADPSATADAGAAPTEADRLKRQNDFGVAFLKAVNQTYGAQLQRSDVPFPDGVEDSDGSDGSDAKSSSSCSVSHGSDGHGTSAMFLGGIAVAIGALSRRRRR
jgi:MYXO-CTERM domain-containing protein